MKRLSLALLFAGALSLASCSGDDTKDTTPDNTPVTGTWSLVKVTGSIAGVTHEFEQGEVTWKFEENIEMIRITNTNDNTAKYSGPESGHYDYQYVANENTPQDCPVNLEVGSFLNMGCKEVDGNTMIFTQTEADGYVFTFKK